MNGFSLKNITHTETFEFQSAQELWEFLDGLSRREREGLRFDVNPSHNALELHLDTEVATDGSTWRNIRIEAEGDQ